MKFYHLQQMDRPREYSDQWNKSEKDRYYILPLICGIQNKKIYICNKQTHWYRKQLTGY